MSLPDKTHCLTPDGTTLCRRQVYSEEWFLIRGCSAFLEARDAGHQYLCETCLSRCEERLKPGKSEAHRPVTSWAKRRMLDLGLTGKDIASRTGLSVNTVLNALNKRYTRPGAQTDALDTIVAALGGRLVVSYKIQEQRRGYANFERRKSRRETTHVPPTYDRDGGERDVSG
jgi:transcriptional regulator with XRE-family HTH domain